MARQLAKNLFRRQEQVAARAKAMVEIEAMLADAPATISEIYRVVAGSRPTLVGYVAYMHKKLRKIRPSGQLQGTSILWELGADPAIPSLDEELDRIFAPKRGIRPAVQIGMWRDDLVAALFGAPRAAHQ